MNPSQNPEESKQNPEPVKSVEGEGSLDISSSIRVLDRNTSSPLSLRIESVTPAELEALSEHFALPLNEVCIRHIVESLYNRGELDAGFLDREKGDGVLVGVNSNRDFKAGGKKFFEERSISISAGSEGPCPPFVMFKLERATPDKNGENVRLVLEWDLDFMEQLGYDRSRWVPASEAMEVLREPELPETFIGISSEVEKAPLEHALSSRATLTVASYESEELTQEEIDRYMAEEEKIADGEFELVPGAIHFRAPNARQQSEILKIAGLTGFEDLVSKGLIENALRATDSGVLENEDDLWELNSLPSTITIREKTIFAFGNPDYAMEEADARYEEEQGSDPDEEEEEEGDDGFEESEEPEFSTGEPMTQESVLQEYYLMGLPTAPGGGEITIHKSDLHSDGPDARREQFLSLDWDKASIMSGSTPEQMWEKAKAASKFMSGMDLNKVMERNRSTQTSPDEVTYDFKDFALTLFVVPKSDPKKS